MLPIRAPGDAGLAACRGVGTRHQSGVALRFAAPCAAAVVPAANQPGQYVRRLGVREASQRGRTRDGQIKLRRSAAHPIRVEGDLHELCQLPPAIH